MNINRSNHGMKCMAYDDCDESDNYDGAACKHVLAKTHIFLKILFSFLVVKLSVFLLWLKGVKNTAIACITEGFDDRFSAKLLSVHHCTGWYSGRSSTSFCVMSSAKVGVHLECSAVGDTQIKTFQNDSEVARGENLPRDPVFGFKMPEMRGFNIPWYWIHSPSVWLAMQNTNTIYGLIIFRDC